MLVAVLEAVTTFDGAEGAWLSAHRVVDPMTLARCERLPTASAASTANV
jgi:hypothetical protein